MKRVDEDAFTDEAESSRPGMLTVILTLLVLLAILASLIWPVLQTRRFHLSTPTPTPPLLQEAQAAGNGPTQF